MNQISVSDDEWTVTMTLGAKPAKKTPDTATTCSCQVATTRFIDNLASYHNLEHWMRANLTADEIENCREGLLAFAPDGQGLIGATKEVLQDFYATFKTTFDAGDRDWIATWKQDPEAFNASWANWSVQDRDLALKVSDVMADVADFASVCISQGYEQLCDSPESIEDVMDELEDSADPTLHNHWSAVFDLLVFVNIHVFKEMIESDDRFQEYCAKHHLPVYKQWKASV